jgi:hypothetical protein
MLAVRIGSHAAQISWICAAAFTSTAVLAAAFGGRPGPEAIA